MSVCRYWQHGWSSNVAAWEESKHAIPIHAYGEQVCAGKARECVITKPMFRLRPPNTATYDRHLASPNFVFAEEKERKKRSVCLFAELVSVPVAGMVRWDLSWQLMGPPLVGEAARHETSAFVMAQGTRRRAGRAKTEGMTAKEDEEEGNEWWRGGGFC